MEKEVLQLIKQGLTHREIRKKTGLSLGTISNIRNKEKREESRVLVIGDLHAPFIRKGYLEFCKDVYKEYKCNMVVFIGDIIDNHASSFHEHDPDGYSAGHELTAAIEQLKPWVATFPKAKVCIGNHDRLPTRQAIASGVSTRWVRSYSEVLGCPDWDFQTSFEIDSVCYTHGVGQKPHLKMVNNRQSHVCGHRHSELEIRYSVSEHDRLWSMQIGWGGDQKAYSMAYAQDLKKGILSCGVVLKNGEQPLAIPMDIHKYKK